MYFTDYEKVFDHMQHDKFLELLNNEGPDLRDISTIKKLY